jgi:hypothetical protein
MPSDLFVISIVVVAAVVAAGAVVIGAILVLAEVARYLDEREDSDRVDERRSWRRR